MTFDSHGELTFRVEDNLLIIEGSGPWNIEAISNSAKDAAPCHKELYGKIWGVLAIIHGDTIHTPDAADLLFSIVVNDKKNGRKASAIILDKTNHPRFGRHHISEIYSNAGEKFEFFDDVEEAKKWLRAQLN